jgi:hypothetical protein
LKLQTLNMPSQPQSTGQQGVFTQLTLAFLPSFVNKLDHILYKPIKFWNKSQLTCDKNGIHPTYILVTQGQSNPTALRGVPDMS